MIDWIRKNYDNPSVEIGGEILPVAIRRHPSAKRMVLRLAPDGREVRLTMPRWGRTSEAMDFIHSRTDWLEAQHAKTERVAPPSPGGSIAHRGEHLTIDWSPLHGRAPQIDGTSIRVGGPEASLPGRLEKWLRAQATDLMSGDLAEYCAAAGKTAPELKLSRAQRRWGSCSESGAVRINWRLIMAPDEVRRSVVAHEVAHLVHFDHSPAFHRFLGDIFEGDIDAANSWLKRHGRSLYRNFG